MSAKIYPDMKNGCDCGNKKFIQKEFHGYSIPECSKIECRKPPRLYVIAANVIDQLGEKKRIKIRHCQGGKRFGDIVDVLSTLKQINIEMEKGTFDIRRYQSDQAREEFKFSNVVQSYIHANERRLERGEISPAGFSNKKASIKNLLPFFKDTDVLAINDRVIRGFYDSFTTKFRTRDQAVQELKTILKFALDDGLIDRLPKFPSISPAKMVNSQSFLTKDEQELVISQIENETHRLAIMTLALYALRPCEIRALKWKDVDLKKKVFYIQSHISKDKDIPGRKSQVNASHELPIVPAFEAILTTIPGSNNVEEYIFKGSDGGFIGVNTLTRTWNKACAKAGLKQITLYQGTKHSTLSFLSSFATDSQLIKLSGHSSTRMLRRYAQASLNDVKKLLSVRGNT